MILFWLIALPLVGGALVVISRRWPIIAAPLTAAVLLAMTVLALSIKQTEYTLFQGRVLELSSGHALFLGISYALTALLALAGVRLNYPNGIYLLSLFFAALTAVSVTIEDSTLGALILGALSIVLVLLMVNSGHTIKLDGLRVLSVLMLVGPLLMIAVWALESQALDPTDQSLVQLGGIALIIVMAIGLGVFPLHFWLPPIYRSMNPVTILLTFIFQVALLLRVSRILTMSSWPGGQQLVYGLMITAGLVTLIGAGVLAAVQSSPNGVLAYTAIADMGIVMFGFGLGTTGMLQTMILHLSFRGIAIAGASIGLGVLGAAGARGRLADLKGTWGTNRLAVIGFVLCGLSLAGAPLTVGFASRFTVMGALGPSRIGMVLAVVAASAGPMLAWGKLALATRGESPLPSQRTYVMLSLLCILCGTALVVAGIYPRLLLLLPAQWLEMLTNAILPLGR